MLTEHIYLEDGGGCVRISAEGIEAGTLHYSWGGSDKIFVDEGKVHPAYVEEGIGTLLFKEITDHARISDVKIVPACSFIEHMFEKYPEEQDVMEKETVAVY